MTKLSLFAILRMRLKSNHMDCLEKQLMLHSYNDDDNNNNICSDPASKLSANLYDIQGVPGGMCQTSGECSLGQTIPI